MLIPCHRGGHNCSWPACPQECDGRRGGPSAIAADERGGGSAQACYVCGGHGVEEVYGGNGTVLEVPCSVCAAEAKKR